MELKEINAKLDALKELLNHCEREITVLGSMVSQYIGEECGLDAPLSTLDLPTRADKVLKRHGVNTVGDLTNLSFKQMMSMSGSGVKTATDTMKALKRFGLNFRE